MSDRSSDDLAYLQLLNIASNYISRPHFAAERRVVALFQRWPSIECWGRSFSQRRVRYFCFSAPATIYSYNVVSHQINRNMERGIIKRENQSLWVCVLPATVVLEGGHGETCQNSHRRAAIQVQILWLQRLSKVVFTVPYGSQTFHRQFKA